MFPEYMLSGYYEPGINIINVEEYICSHNIQQYPIWTDVFIKTVKGDYITTDINVRHTLLGKSQSTGYCANVIEILGFQYYSPSDSFAGRADLLTFAIKQPSNLPWRRKKPLQILQDVIDKSPEELQEIVDKGVYNVYD